MALIELCNSEALACEEFVICVDRQLKSEDRQVWVKNLRWVGFEAGTLADWTDGADITSDKWLFFSMET
jgi:Ornithine decarboxylase antizyme